LTSEFRLRPRASPAHARVFEKRAEKTVLSKLSERRETGKE
jgi:hypothetical protein